MSTTESRLEGKRPAPDGAYTFLRETGPIELRDKKNRTSVEIMEEPVCEIGGSCMEVTLEARRGSYKHKIIVAAHITRDNEVVFAGKVDHRGIGEASDQEVEYAMRRVRALLGRAM